MPPRPVHLVPTQHQVDQALAQGRNAFAVADFLERVTADLPVRPAPLEVTQLATSLALESMRDESGWDRGDAFARALDDALGVLRRAGVEARVLRRSTARRAHWLAALLERTVEILDSHGLFDLRAIGWIAARAIDEDRTETLPTAVVIDGLYHHDPSHWAWIEALARRIPVTMRMPRGAPDALLSALEGRWHSLERAPDLELFDLASPTEVAVTEARTDDAEARAIAHAAAEAMRRGAPPEKIAIVVPDLDEEFLDSLRASLLEARVPFREPRGRPPGASPAVSAALAWLDLVAGPLDRDTWIDLLRTRAVDPAPFVTGPTPSIRRRRALALAGRLARVPVKTDRDGTLLAEVLAAEIPKDSDDRWMVEAVDRVARARAALAGEATRSEFAAKLGEMWRALGLATPSNETLAALAAAKPASREADLLAAQVRDHAAGFGALLETAERVASAAATLDVSHARVSAARFRSDLHDALSRTTPRGTRRPLAVQVVRPTEVVSLTTDLMILARGNAQTLETTAARPPFFDDEWGAALPMDRRPPSVHAIAAANRVALLAAIAGARRVVMTRSETDDGGRPAIPSALFVELAAGRTTAREPASRVHASASFLSAREAELGRLSRGGSPEDDDVRRRVAVEKERLDFFLDPRKPAARFTGAIDVENAALRSRLQDAFGGTSVRPISVTAIERAAQCRFAAFAGAVLGASSSDTIGEELEPWQKGSLVHRALFIALDAVRRRVGRLGHDELVALGTSAAQKALVRDVGSPLYRAEVERALRAVASVVEWSVDGDGDFRFAHGELSFGEAAGGAAGDAPWPALVIGAREMSVHVKGRIDRIDFSPDGSRARIIDYKTGALPAWRDVGSSYFQPPLYAYVVLLQMGQLSAPEIRALYLDTSRRPPRPLPTEKNQVFTVEAMRGAERRASEVVALLWDGQVAPRPADAAICSRCDARDICRRPAAMPVEDLELDADGGAA
jgi:RecB family exonuclease